MLKLKLGFILQAEARGGKTLSLLHEETIELVANTQAQTMCLHLTQAAAVPFFQSLKQWLNKGIVFDPFGEVCIIIFNYDKLLCIKLYNFFTFKILTVLFN